MRLTTLLLAGSLCAIGLSAAFAEMAPSNMGAARLPTQGGQAAFAAIQEIVGMLDADPNTEWSKVNIDALRQHLIDMDNVALRARITYEPTTSGERVNIAGDGEVRDSIQRMATMHAAMAGDTPDWRMEAAKTPDGARITITTKTARGFAKMKALGLIGMMAEGMHHARHHMMLATGGM